MSRNLPTLNDPPQLAPVVNTIQRVTTVWEKWYEFVKRLLLAAPRVVGAVDLSGQGASIAATSLVTDTLPAGTYEVTVFQRVTRADNTGSSLTSFVTVTESGLTVTQTGAANTSNATGTGKTDTFMPLIDAGSAIKYGTTYSTTGGAPSMQYRLSVRAKLVPS